jgi:uncharacterized membrane protein
VIGGIALVCSKLLANTKPNQNAVMQSIITYVSQSAIIVVYQNRPCATAVARNEYAISKDVYVQAAQKKVKRVLSICCSDDEPTTKTTKE